MENMYAVEIDGEFVLIQDPALGEMVFENGWDIDDIAQRFMISSEDVVEVLCGR